MVGFRIGLKTGLSSLAGAAFADAACPKKEGLLLLLPSV